MEAITFEDFALVILFVVAIAMVTGGLIGYALNKWRRDRW